MNFVCNRLIDWLIGS